MPTEIQEFPEIEEFPESEGQAPKPVVAPTGTIGPSTLSATQKLRISPVGRFLLGPTEIERQGMVGETPAEQRGVLELGETLLGATAPGATPWVQKPAMALARAMTPIAQALPAVVKAVGGGLAAQKLAAIPSGAAQGVAGAALGFPLAPIPGLKTKAGVAALAAFGTEYLASQPEQLAAFKAAIDRGDYGEATKIAVGDVATGAALGLGAREARRAQLESRIAQAEGKPPPIPAKPSVSETTPPVPAAEMPETPTGDVVMGDAGMTHPDIIARDKIKAEDIDQRGFVDESGQFKDREQTAQETGLPTEREPGRQHSTDLPESKVGLAGDIPVQKLQSAFQKFVTMAEMTPEEEALVQRASTEQPELYNRLSKLYPVQIPGVEPLPEGKVVPSGILNKEQQQRLDNVLARLADALSEKAGKPITRPAEPPPPVTEVAPTKQLTAGAAAQPGTAGETGEAVSPQPAIEPTISQPKAKGKRVKQPTPPTAAAAKVEEQVQTVAATEGQRPAKEVKSELVARLEKALADADGNGVVEINIPGDGDFRVPNTKEALTELLARAKKVSTTAGTPKGAPKGGVGDVDEQAEAVAKAYGSPEAAYRSAVRQRDALQGQGPPATAEERDAWNSQVQGANALIKALYDKTKAAEYEAKGEKARKMVETYRDGQESFQKEIDKIRKVKRQTAKHRMDLMQMEERLAENKKRTAQYEQEAEQFEQLAAKEKAALESQPTPSPEAKPQGGVQSLEAQRQAVMAKVEANQKLTPAEKKIWDGMKGGAKTEEKPQIQAGLGPEQSMGGALYGFKGPAEIEQLTDALKGVRGERPTLSQRIKTAFGVGERFTTAKTLLGKAVSGLKATGDYLKTKFEGVNTVDELLREKGVLSAELEKRGWRVREWEKQAKTSVPSARDQAAIAKWVDAGGDRAELQRGFAETKPEFKQAYQDALNLKGDLLAAAENVRNYFEARLQEAVDAGVVKDGVEDYIHRMYEAKPALQKAALAHVQTGLLSTRPSLAKKRVFQFDWEAEKLGYRPVQSFIPRIAEYESSLSRAIAARAFIKKATTMKAPDGRPVIDVKGVGIPIEDPTTGAREATLIKPQFNPARANEPGTPNYRGDYVNKEFPALSKWKWVSEDAGGKPIFVQGDVAIHPDFVHRISALLEPSRVRFGRYGAILRPALGVSSAFKQTMLDLSGFHQVQIAVHGLEHKVNPFNLVQTIDFENPNVGGLLKGGMTLGGDYRYSKEGLVGASLTRQIPGLGPVMESYHQWLFQDFIPRVKTTMALKALERNRARYPNLSQEQIFNKTAMQANSAFGELNYIMLERSATARDIARIIFLAPDFLEARGRFAAEALSKGGKRFSNEQRTALFLGAITMYITARIGNKVLDDQYHFEPENAFSLVHNGEAYSLRTVQGDILHMLEKPLQFWMHRLNPVFGRTTLEMATQRDEFGRRRTIPQVLWDTVSNIMPIALRTSRERSIWESLANSFGITERRWQDTDSAYKLAKNWKDKHGIGERGEFIYDPEKDPLRGLKIALSRSDDAGAAAEIRKLLLSKVYTTAKLDAYFSRYAESPFTGSRENDRKWFASLSEDEKKTVTAARQHKKEIGKLYRKALSKYYAARTNQ